MTTTPIEELNPPVECAEGCGRFVIPFAPGVQHEIVGWADLKAPKSARRKSGGLNKVADWHATGRVRCARCIVALSQTGNAGQGRLA